MSVNCSIHSVESKHIDAHVAEEKLLKELEGLVADSDSEHEHLGQRALKPLKVSLLHPYHIPIHLSVLYCQLRNQVVNTLSVPPLLSKTSSSHHLLTLVKVDTKMLSNDLRLKQSHGLIAIFT